MLDNYKKQPRDSNWENLETHLNEERVHKQIGSKFEDLAVTPPLKNWDAIESKMSSTKVDRPYRLPVRIAASIALLILAYTFTSTPSSQERFANIFQDISKYDEPLYELCQDPSIVALDIVKPVLKKNKKQRRKKKAISKHKRLLDIILERDEHIESQVDSALIADLIRPTEMLSTNSMFANLNGPYFYYYQGADFRYMYTLPEIDYHLKMPSDTQRLIKHIRIHKRNTP